MSNYYNPVRVIKTDDWYSELNFRIEDLKISSPIIITTPGNRKRLKLDLKYDINSIFSEVESNTSFKECNNALKFCQKKQEKMPQKVLHTPDRRHGEDGTRLRSLH